MKKCRAYLHEKLNTSKGVIRTRELALATEEEIASAPGKQGVTNIRRTSIWKGEEQIQTSTYILTSNQRHTPKEVKINYCLERVGQYGHHREACRGQCTSKCGEKNQDHLKEDCLKQIQCVNCQQDHLAYVRFCDVHKKKEILEKKHEECVLSGSKGNCWDLHGRKHLRPCCAEGRYNQSRRQI